MNILLIKHGILIFLKNLSPKNPMASQSPQNHGSHFLKRVFPYPKFPMPSTTLNMVWMNPNKASYLWTPPKTSLSMSCVIFPSLNGNLKPCESLLNLPKSSYFPKQPPNGRVLISKESSSSKSHHVMYNNKSLSQSLKPIFQIPS